MDIRSLSLSENAVTLEVLGRLVQLHGGAGELLEALDIPDSPHGDNTPECLFFWHPLRDAIKVRTCTRGDSYDAIRNVLLRDLRLSPPSPAAPASHHPARYGSRDIGSSVALEVLKEAANTEIDLVIRTRSCLVLIEVKWLSGLGGRGRGLLNQMQRELLAARLALAVGKPLLEGESVPSEVHWRVISRDRRYCNRASLALKLKEAVTAEQAQKSHKAGQKERIQAFLSDPGAYTAVLQRIASTCTSVGGVTWKRLYEHLEIAGGEIFRSGPLATEMRRIGKGITYDGTPADLLIET